LALRVFIIDSHSRQYNVFIANYLGQGKGRSVELGTNATVSSDFIDWKKKRGYLVTYGL